MNAKRKCKQMNTTSNLNALYQCYKKQEKECIPNNHASKFCGVMEHHQILRQHFNNALKN